MSEVLKCLFCNEVHFTAKHLQNDKIACEYTDYSTNDIQPEKDRFTTIQRCIANKLITETQNKVNDVEPFVQDAQLYIYDYFSDLRNKADLAREQLTQLIEQRHEKCIDQLKELETKCKQNAQQIAVSFEEKLDQAKTELETLKETIKTPILNCDEAMELTDRIETQFNNTDYLISKFKNDLLKNKQCTIKSSLEINYELQIIDSNETDTIKLEFSIDYFNPVKPFNRYVEYFESNEWKVTKGIYWKICHVKIEHDLEYFLVFELLVKSEQEKLLEKLDQLIQYFALDSANLLTKLQTNNRVASGSIKKGLPVSFLHDLILNEENHDLANLSIEQLKVTVDVAIAE